MSQAPLSNPGGQLDCDAGKSQSYDVSQVACVVISVGGTFDTDGPLHIQWRKSMATRRQCDADTVIESMRLVIRARILRLVQLKVDLR